MKIDLTEFTNGPKCWEEMEGSVVTEKSLAQQGWKTFFFVLGCEVTSERIAEKRSTLISNLKWRFS